MLLPLILLAVQQGQVQGQGLLGQILGLCGYYLGSFPQFTEDFHPPFQIGYNLPSGQNPFLFYSCEKHLFPGGIQGLGGRGPGNQEQGQGGWGNQGQGGWGNQGPGGWGNQGPGGWGGNQWGNRQPQQPWGQQNEDNAQNLLRWKHSHVLRNFPHHRHRHQGGWLFIKDPLQGINQELVQAARGFILQLGAISPEAGNLIKVFDFEKSVTGKDNTENINLRLDRTMQVKQALLEKANLTSVVTAADNGVFDKDVLLTEKQAHFLLNELGKGGVGSDVPPPGVGGTAKFKRYALITAEKYYS
ncbi:hypothetical protein ANCDUO_02807 [Ancylostoma duodenale]|uniref:Uncharacterized protein n=1 Tax=Ancylostoma duodenale TaxID=51022 RepID=A0A0C2HBL7_9BILA|nr:hypothetical protein ANCDUO_02807 [Ancylostoma duodenale]